MRETATGRAVRIGVPRSTSRHKACFPRCDTVCPVRFRFLFLLEFNRSRFTSIGMVAWRLWMKFTL
jgi:hypothetical protein